MDTLRFKAERGRERFEIIEGQGEGFYVLRYLDGFNTHDYLQTDIPMAFRCAEDKWGVSHTEWNAASTDELPLWKRDATSDPG